MDKHRHGLGNCARCPTREMCNVLCSEAEAYVDQDALAQKDILFSEANIRVDTLTDDFRNSNLPTTEAKVLSLFFDYRMTGYKIAKELGISINHAYRIIRKFKAILLKNIKN